MRKNKNLDSNIFYRRWRIEGVLGFTLTSDMKRQNEGTALIWAQMRNWLFKFLFVYSLSYFPLFYNIKNKIKKHYAYWISYD